MGKRILRWLPLAVIAAVAMSVVFPNGMPPGQVEPVRAAPVAAPPPKPNGQPAPRPLTSLKVGEQQQMRTRYSTTTYNANHTFTTHTSPRPVNYRQGKGGWQPIDSTLVATKVKGYAYQNRANSFQTLFKQTLSNDYFHLNIANQPVSLSLAGASQASATVKGSSIEYANALPHVTAQYNVGAEGVQETLALQNRSAPASYRFMLKAPAKTTTQQRQDGSWAFRLPASPGPSFYLTAPFAYDSGARAVDPLQRHAQMAVKKVSGGFQVDMTIDQSWLSSSARKFPVFLDPSVTIQPDVNDVSFQADCPNCSPWPDSDGFLYIGTDDSHPWRGAVEFDLSAIPAGANVTSASMGLYYAYCLSVGSQNCGFTSEPVDAHLMTAPWDYLTTTSQVQFDSNVLSNFTLPVNAPNQWMTWNVTSAVNGWVSGSTPNYGLYLKRTTEPLSSGGPVPFGMQYTQDQSLVPQLNVTYSFTDAVHLNQPAVLHSNGAEVSWSQYTGPSGAQFQSYQVHRSTTPGFTPSASTLLTTINDIAVTSYRDTTAAPNGTFYYAVVANSSKSNEVKVNLPSDGNATMFLQPGPSDGKDTMLWNSGDASGWGNWGAYPFMNFGTNATGTYRDLLQFDLQQIPLTATNVSAQLSMWHWGGVPAMSLHSYPAMIEWDQGTGSLTADAQDGADWYEASPGTSWVSPGGDFDSTIPSSQVSFPANDTHGWSTFDVSNIVSQWVSGQMPNLGFLVKADDESLAAAHSFITADYTTTPQLRPELQISYTDGSHATPPTVAISSPGSGATVSGNSVKLSATATAADGHPAQVQFKVDGNPVASTWDSTTVSNGPHTITAVATDDVGNTASYGPVSVTVANYAAPLVSITTPSGGSTLTGTVSITGTASAAAGLSGVDIYVDNDEVGAATVTGSTFSYSLDTTSYPLDTTQVPVFDGAHTLTARASDVNQQVTVSGPVSVTVTNTVGSQYIGGISPAPGSTNIVPQVVTYDPNASNSYAVDIQVTNNSTISWGSASLCYRWVSVDPMIASSIDQELPCNTFKLGPGVTRTVNATVAPPPLGDGVAQAQYQLWFDLYDRQNNVWFSAKGNQPFVNTVTVNHALKTALGLESYYQYTQDPVGGGMTHMVNVANGDSILTWTPFNMPGTGLATVVRLTYNSLENHSDSLAGPNWSLSISSLTRLGLPLDIHPKNQNNNDPNPWIGFIDGDGTYHRFQGAQDASGNVYYVEPPGVHLYLRQVSTDTALQGKYWALTRPDRVTFYYDNLGFPTWVTDKNGNSLQLTVTKIDPADDPGKLKYHVTAVTDQGGRVTNVVYYTKADAPHSHIRGLVKSITDHDGHELDFFYNKDGNLNELLQKGGSDAHGNTLADRTWQFTYTTSSGAGQATNPNAESTKLYSVKDPNGNQTTFAYITSGQDKWKLTSFTDRAGSKTSFAYDDANLATTVTEPVAASVSRLSTYSYDSTGQVTSIQQQKDANTSVTTSLHWTADFAVDSLTDANQKVTKFTDDANGYETELIDATASDTRLGYQNIPVDAGDAQAHWCPSNGTINGSACAPRTIPHISLLQTETQPNGVANGGGYQWVFGYDANNVNLMSVTDPLHNTSKNDYNGDGTVSDTVDPNGNRTQYLNYDKNGLPQKVVDALGNITLAGYDADGLLQFTQDPDHTSQNGQPLCGTCTDPSQYQTVYHYDSFNRLGAVSQPKSTTLAQGTLIWTDTSYDANDNVVAQVDPYYATGDTKAGGTTTARYDAMDRTTLTTGPDTAADPAGERTQYLYDAASRLIQEVTPVGTQNRVQAGATTSPGTINYTYDLLDEQLTQTSYHKDASGVHALTTYNCYDNVGNLTSVTQPDANLSSLSCPAVQGTTPFTSFYTYDAAHRQLTSTDGDGHQTSYIYDFDGNQTKVTNPNNITTTNTYDQLDRLVRSDQPFITGSSPHTVTTEVQYDAAGNKTADISARAYDASPDKQTFNNYVTRYHYDKDNRLVQTDLPVDGTYSTPHYVLQTYDPSGFQTAVSKPVTTTDPGQLTSSQETTVRYFDTGWIYTSQDPGNPAVHFDYTAKGEQSFRAPENGQGVVDTAQQMTWDYYPDGQLKDRFDSMGQPVTYSYNADDALTSSSNAAGLTDMMMQGPINTQNMLDDLDRMVRTDEQMQGDLNWTFSSYAYDLNSNLTDQVVNGQESSPNGKLVKAGDASHTDYDQANWFTDQYDYGMGGTAGSPVAGAHRTLETFTPTGMESRRELDSYSSGNWPVQQVTTWDYYANDKLNHLTTTNNIGATIESHTVGYLEPAPAALYDDGNRTEDVFSQIEPGGSTQTCQPTCRATYTYDPQDRLVETNDGHGTTTSYTLDPSGNETFEHQNGALTKTITYNANGNGDQIATVKSGGQEQDYHYDNLGNLQCVTTPAGSAADCNLSNGATQSPNLIQDYMYDPLNRLKTYRAYSNGTQTDSATYVYDALDRQVSETETHPGMTSPQITTSNYFGLSGQLTQEQLSSGGTTTQVKDYSYSPNGNRLTFTNTPYSAGNPQNPTTYSYGYNVHDSVSELVDPTGNVKASYGYTPYGQPDTALTQGDTSQTSPLNPFRYEAKRFDSGSQSYNTGARQYSPGSAHFLTADVFHGALANLGLSSDLLTQDRYALTGANPLNFIEWDGHDGFVDGGGGAQAPDIGAAALAAANPAIYQAYVNAGYSIRGSAPVASQPNNSNSGSGNSGLSGIIQRGVSGINSFIQGTQQAINNSPCSATNQNAAAFRAACTPSLATAVHPDILSCLHAHATMGSGLASMFGCADPMLMQAGVQSGNNSVNTPVGRNASMSGGAQGAKNAAEEEAASAAPGARGLPEYSGGATQGILRYGDDNSIALRSGVSGPSQEVRGQGLPGFNGNQLLHVEGHAAAFMRTNGIFEADLEINRVPCQAGSGGGCAGLLPRMLPEGATLRVSGPNGYFQVFVGLPD